MRRVVVTKESLRNKWASIPGVTFNDVEEVVVKRKPGRPRIHPAKPKNVVPPPPMEDEISTIEASALLGVTAKSFRRVILHFDLIPARHCFPVSDEVRGCRKTFYYKKKDVIELWKKLCQYKGVKEGTKLGDLSFLGHVREVERVKLFSVK